MARHGPEITASLLERRMLSIPRTSKVFIGGLQMDLLNEQYGMLSLEDAKPDDETVYNEDGDDISPFQDPNPLFTVVIGKRRHTMLEIDRKGVYSLDQRSGFKNRVEVESLSTIEKVIEFIRKDVSSICARIFMHDWIKDHVSFGSGVWRSQDHDVFELRALTMYPFNMDDARKDLRAAIIPNAIVVTVEVTNGCLKMLARNGTASNQIVISSDFLFMGHIENPNYDLVNNHLSDLLAPIGITIEKSRPKIDLSLGIPLFENIINRRAKDVKRVNG